MLHNEQFDIVIYPAWIFSLNTSAFIKT